MCINLTLVDMMPYSPYRYVSNWIHMAINDDVFIKYSSYKI